MVNGLLGTIHNINYAPSNSWLKKDLIADFLPDGYENVDILNEDVFFRQLHIDNKLLTTGEPTVNAKNFKYFPKKIKPKEFEYGYCITA